MTKIVGYQKGKFHIMCLFGHWWFCHNFNLVTKYSTCLNCDARKIEQLCECKNEHYCKKEFLTMSLEWEDLK